MWDVFMLVRVCLFGYLVVGMWSVIWDEVVGLMFWVIGC